MTQNMFCFQCEQTAGCKGCTGNAGVCGKKADTARLQDALTGALIGLARAVQGNEDLITAETNKLVLDGQLIEGEPPQDPVFLSDLSVDPGETTNLAAQMPGLTAQLKEKALSWRSRLEENWDRKYAANYKRTT